MAGCQATPARRCGRQRASRRHRIEGLATLPPSPAMARAQPGFPRHPVRMVLPFGPGVAPDGGTILPGTGQAVAVNPARDVARDPGLAAAEGERCRAVPASPRRERVMPTPDFQPG
jgi:hypothetical protein